jgi:hypothetical protein
MSARNINPERSRLMISRRQAVASGLALGLAPGVAAAGPTRGRALPFSWDTVPCQAHLGTMDRDFTDREARFLVDNFHFTTLEKAQGSANRGSTEAGTAFAARQLKELKPDHPVIYYMNGYINYERYRSTTPFQPDHFYVRNAAGEFDMIRGLRRYDLSQPEARAWWIRTVAAAIEETGTDGVFVDALIQTAFNTPGNAQRLGAERSAAIAAGSEALMAELRARLGPDRIILYNGLRAAVAPGQWADGGLRYAPHATGSMLEHFGFLQGARPEQMEADMAVAQRALSLGQVVVIKGWPSFSWLDEGVTAQAEATLLPRAQAEITFPLAAYLVIAEPGCYFSYSWGYREFHGWFGDYPELRRPLGPPRGPAVREGRRYTRAFAHAAVEVDLDQRAAEIRWS